MGTIDPMRMAVRVVAALAVLGGGLIHLKLYGDSYRHIDTVGPMFLLNGITSVVLAVTLVVWRHWLVTLAALGLVNGSLLAFAISRTDHGIFDFNERGFHPSPYAAWALVFEIVAAALLVVLLAWDLAPADDTDWRP
jgi:hypothetical protein